MKILLLRDNEPDMGYAMAAGFESLGCLVVTHDRLKLREVADWREFDIVLTYGPHNGSMVPVSQILDKQPPGERPFFIWWLNENTPNIQYPVWTQQMQARLRFNSDRVLQMFLLDQNSSPGCLWRGHRARVFGELLHLTRSGRVDLLVSTSGARTSYLKKLGIEALTAQIGYDQRFGEDLGLKRDIDVLYLGNLATRRRRIIRRLNRELSNRGIHLKIEDGRHRYIEGHSRTMLINRARILLNVMKSPSDWTGHRLLLGISNKALIVSEPLIDTKPFLPGEHFISAPIDEMADSIAYFLDHEQERDQICQNAHEFIVGTLSMPAMCKRILDRYYRYKSLTL